MSLFLAGCSRKEYAFFSRKSESGNYYSRDSLAHKSLLSIVAPTIDSYHQQDLEGSTQNKIGHWPADVNPVANNSTTSHATAQLLNMKQLGLWQKIKVARALKKEFKKVAEVSAINNHKSRGESQLTALLLAIFLGLYGAHRFYLGYTWQGFLMMFTYGGCLIWWISDIIRIIVGTLEPQYGPYGKSL